MWYTYSIYAIIGIYLAATYFIGFMPDTTLVMLMLILNTLNLILRAMYTKNRKGD